MMGDASLNVIRRQTFYCAMVLHAQVRILFQCADRLTHPLQFRKTAHVGDRYSIQLLDTGPVPTVQTSSADFAQVLSGQAMQIKV